MAKHTTHNGSIRSTLIKYHQGISKLTTYSYPHLLKSEKNLGRLGGAVVKRLPSAQGVIPALWDRAPHRAPPLGACFFLSLSPAVFPLSLAVSLSHKKKKT